MGRIEEAIEEVINGQLSEMDFSDIITSEVRDTWDMDELDRVDETVDRVDAIEAWIHDAEDKVSPQTIINLESSIKNLCENVNDLKLRLVELEEQVSKSFFQKLMFWR